MSREASGRLRNSVLRITVVAAIATWASARLVAAPLVVPAALHRQRPTEIERTQYIHLGKPYCWYPYGWAGAGWYRCGYGTRAGAGWGGTYGWNGWLVPRTYHALPAVPGYRFRHYD